MGFLGRFGRKAKTRVAVGNVRFPTVTFTKTGTELPLVSNIDAFCSMVLAEEECALQLSLREYKSATTKMLQSFGKHQNPFSFPIICQGCTLNLQASTSFMVGLTGFDKAPHIAGFVAVGGEDRRKYGRNGKCFKCGNDKALVVYSKTKI
jgi:hypothetical protein